MCIRDRIGRAFNQQVADEQTPDAEGAQVVDHRPFIQWVAPVSYTHLRAHETVLDLVCRLLLEKKNHRPKHPTLRS